MLVCHGEPLESGTRKDSPTVPSTDGCIYKNVSHAKDKKFYDGCSQQCMCFSNGDVTCQPRYVLKFNFLRDGLILCLGFEVLAYFSSQNPKQ